MSVDINVDMVQNKCKFQHFKSAPQDSANNEIKAQKGWHRRSERAVVEASVDTNLVRSILYIPFARGSRRFNTKKVVLVSGIVLGVFYFLIRIVVVVVVVLLLLCPAKQKIVSYSG